MIRTAQPAVVVLPVGSFAGTVSVSTSTLVAVVSDVADSLHASGIDRPAVISLGSVRPGRITA
jgi:creatinine amidohydrolase/Fe(II)-dependent formamide hydrolase-like protein